MSKKILLVGCGQLGSRHLQAIAALREVNEIHVVDPNKGSLDLGKLRLKEISDINRKIKFSWLNELKNGSSNGDLCIIATQAKGRCPLVKEITRSLKYKNFLIEKIVTQSMDEYEDLMSFCKKNNLKVWVNCKTRAYAIHKYIKSRLDQKEPFFFSDCGGNHGLANNGIHAADLFVFYDETTQIKSNGCRIDSILHPSKRGRGIFDLSGILQGYSKKGSDLLISYQSNHESPDHITIVSPRGRFIVDHFQKVAYESSAASKWEWRRIPIKENYLVSHTTKTFARDILLKGKCDLPTLFECFPAHRFILSVLLPYFTRLLRTNNNYCPVT